jgi:hypothetical protein
VANPAITSFGRFRQHHHRRSSLKKSTATVAQPTMPTCCARGGPGRSHSCSFDHRRRPETLTHPETNGTTFTFLGFTHIWGKSRAGKTVVRQVMAKNRHARALATVTAWCRSNRHQPIPDQHAHLTAMMRGHYAYYGITGNARRLSWYARKVARIWQKWLSRRGHGNLPAADMPWLIRANRRASIYATHAAAEALLYSSWRRHQYAVSLRPLGARSSH